MLTAVTGAAGFIGYNLLQALLAEGRPVRALIYGEGERERLAGLPVELIEADITQPQTLDAAFAGANVVYHLAGYIALRPEEAALAEKINIEGVQNVAAAAQAAGVRRLVHFSSFHALVQTPYDRPLREENPLVGRDSPIAYNRSKAEGERIIQKAIENGLDAVIIRPTAVVGINDFQPSAFGTALLDIAQRRMPVLVRGGCDWVDVRDLVAGAILAEKKGRTGAAYILGGSYATLQQIAEHIAEIAGVKPPWGYVPMWMAEMGVPLVGAWAKLSNTTPRLTRTSLDALRANPDIRHERAAQELGYRPRPLRDTLRDTLAWHGGQRFL